MLAPLDARPVGSWHSYTSQATVLELIKDATGRIWASTEGGLFIVEQGEITRSLTPTEGMYRINPATLEYDTANDRLWLGYNDGMFESYNPKTESFRTFSDIARATRFSPRGINQFVMKNGDVLIATDFGLVLFDPDREVTIDTYSNLGNFPSGTRVNTVMIGNGRIFAGTPRGVAVSGSFEGDLVVPDNWISYGSEAGLGGNVSALVSFQDTVYALMGDKILWFDGNNWNQSGLFEGKEIHNLGVSQNGTYLVAWNDKEVMVWPEDHFDLTIQTGLPIHVIRLDDVEERVLAGSTNQGILDIDLGTGDLQEQYLPPGPYMNSFSDLTVKNGILASGSDNLWGRRGLGTSQSGYYLFRDNEWYNFNNRTNTLLQQKNFNSVFMTAGTSDYFFFGSWGGGFSQHDRKTDEITIWDSRNSPMKGVAENRDYIVVTGLAADRHDQLWVISRVDDAVNPLYRFDPGTEEWADFPKLSGLGSNDLYREVTVDSYDQLWITLRSDRDDGRGVAVKRIEEGRIKDGVDLRDQSGRGNLPHPNVNAIVQDRRGEIWMGTDRGVVRFPFPQRVIDGTASDRQANLLINADETADAPYLLRTSNVTSIAVNSANQKWIGTDGEGLWLVEDEGGRHRALKNFTTENSPLVSNSITSVAYDDITGQVFIATDLGLVSYTDVVRGSVAEMDELFIYPNPFSYNQEVQERVVIDRLSAETTVRILTVDGRLVRRLETRGGRVEWDVRDFKGDRVATGVYFVVSVDSENEQRGVGKLVVIR